MDYPLIRAWLDVAERADIAVEVARGGRHFHMIERARSSIHDVLQVIVQHSVPGVASEVPPAQPWHTTKPREEL